MSGDSQYIPDEGGGGRNIAASDWSKSVIISVQLHAEVV